MAEWLATLLNMLAQFTGGRGGIDHVIVNYAIAAFFWGVLLVLVRARWRHSPAPREVLLTWGLGFALSRELFMIFFALLQALNFVDPVSLHTIFPPLEHELHDLALVLIAGAFLRYLLDDPILVRRFLTVGLGVTLACYLATFWWWADYITANPTSKFGQVWPDWVFHINRTIWAIVPAVILARGTDGWVRNAIVTAFACIATYAALKLPDMALGEVYEDIFTPIARSFYLIAIPIFGYVYIREQWEGRQRAEQALQSAHADLENQVTDRTRELHDALLKEEKTAADLEAFAYSVAHDLKAPVRAMGGFSQALVEDYGKTLDGTAHGYLEHINAGAARMGNLIDDLLRFSRLGREELHFEPLDLTEVLAQGRADLKLEIEATGALIHVRDELPVIEGHRLSIELLFQNLLSNAIKFSREGVKPEITLSVRADGDDYLVSVKDNGIGIEASGQSRIFDIFKRLHAAEDYAGTGIGLAIVKKGAELHHGSVSVWSEPGVGSTFEVRLPRQQPRPEIDDQAVSEDAHGASLIG